MSHFFIADFAIPEKKLIIELDGEIHDYQIAADTERTAILKELGYEVVRFRNEEVISAIEHVLQKLREIVENK